MPKWNRGRDNELDRMAPQPLSSEEQLVALLEITQSLMSEMDLDNLLWLIVGTASALLYADRTSLYLVDPDRKQLWSKIAQDAEIKEIRLNIGQGLAGYVAQTGETLNIADAHQDPRFEPHFDRVGGYRTRTVLAMPMKNRRGEIVGVIQVINKLEGRFTESDENLLAALTSSAAIALENAQLHSQVRLMFDSFISTLAATIDARDQQTAGHSQRVTTYSVIIGREMGLSSQRLHILRIAALLHDFGKIGVPEAILTKAGELTPEETAVMRQHAQKTKDILEKIYFSPEFQRVPEIASQHHERLDGSGYPDAWSNGQLSLEGRILAVADVFDSLTHIRYYREPLSYQEAFARIAEHKGKWFDPDVVDALERVMTNPEFEALREELDL